MAPTMTSSSCAGAPRRGPPYRRHEQDMSTALRLDAGTERAHESGLGLPPDAFGLAFPFHIAFDRSLRIVQHGSAARRLLPSLAAGRALFDVVVVRRPSSVYDFEAIVENARQLFILAGRE